MSAAAYMVGRKLAVLAQGASATGALFASELVDDMRFDDLTFKHCTFANVSFKSAQLINVRFEDCVFLRCYFRQTRLEDSVIVATKFIDCDLAKIDIRHCDIKYYNTFEGCFVKFRELESSLPNEPNLRSHLCLNLASEARALGALSDAGRYRQKAARAQEEHLYAAFMNRSQYYREKFTGTKRIAPLREWLGSRARGYLWGYKTSFLVVFRNWALATFGVFPLLFLLDLAATSRGARKGHAGDVVELSLSRVLPGVDDSTFGFHSAYAVMVADVEAIVGLLMGGLAIALLFRAVFDRWR